jgi:hypothetical protein
VSSLGIIGEVGGALGGLATAVGTGYLVGGSLRKRRLERVSQRQAQERQAEEDKRWKLTIKEALEGRSATRFLPGFRGVVERVDNLEIKEFGTTRAAIEPTGRDA